MNGSPISPEELKMTSLAEAPGAQAVYLYRQVDRNDIERLRLNTTTCESRFSPKKVANTQISRSRSGRAESIFPRFVRVRFGRTEPSQCSTERRTSRRSKKPRAQSTWPRLSHFRTYKSEVLLNIILIMTLKIINFLFGVDSKRRTVHQEGSVYAQAVQPFPLDRTVVLASRPSPWHQTPEEGPDHVVRMTAQNIPAFVTEDFMPPPDELKFRVSFVYHDEPIETDLNKFWRNYGKKRHGQVKGSSTSGKPWKTPSPVSSRAMILPR